MRIWPADWTGFLLPDAPVMELVVRAVLIYVFLFAVMRIQGRRVFGGFALSDLLVTLLLAVAVREGITGGFRTIGDAMVSGGTILFCDRLVDRLAYHFPLPRRLLRQRPTLLIRDGELVLENARRQLVTRAEIDEKLREQGIASVRDVQEARLEPDGTLSILRRSR